MSSVAGWTPTCNQWETLLAWLLRPRSLKANCTRFFVWILRCYNVMFWFDLVTQNKKTTIAWMLIFLDVSWEIPSQWDMIMRKHTQNLKRRIVFNMPINRADPQLLRLVCDGLQAQGIPGSFEFWFGHLRYLRYKPPVDHRSLVLSDLHPILIGPSQLLAFSTVLIMVLLEPSSHRWAYWYPSAVSSSYGNGILPIYRWFTYWQSVIFTDFLLQTVSHY